MYAVAVREDDEVYLFLRVRRNAKGEVFLMFPREQEGWNPHSSIHADGTHHQKAFYHKFHVQTGEKLTVGFQETKNVVTAGIASGEAQAINMRCKADEFSHVFEIPAEKLRAEKYRTYVSVDLTPPNGKPIITPDACVLQQHIFQDAVPWIVITLFGT